MSYLATIGLGNGLASNQSPPPIANLLGSDDSVPIALTHTVRHCETGVSQGHQTQKTGGEGGSEINKVPDRKRQNQKIDRCRKKNKGSRTLYDNQLRKRQHMTTKLQRNTVPTAKSPVEPHRDFTHTTTTRTSPHRLTTFDDLRPLNKKVIGCPNRHKLPARSLITPMLVGVKLLGQSTVGAFDLFLRSRRGELQQFQALEVCHPTVPDHE